MAMTAPPDAGEATTAGPAPGARTSRVRPPPSPHELLPNDWLKVEPRLGKLWVIDLQRLKRRAKTRIPLVLLLAALMAGGVYRMLSRRGASYDAAVFVAIDESSLSAGRNSIPGRELTNYVATVLIPDQALIDLANRRNLHRLRKKLGDQYAVDELRMQFELEVIQNDYAERRAPQEARTAHLQLTVYDATPEEANLLAGDLAEIVVKTSTARAAQEAKELTADVERTLAVMRENVDALAKELSAAKEEQTRARLSGDPAAIAAASLSVERAEQNWRRADVNLEETSRRATVEASAETLQAAGLGVNARIVDRRNAGALIDKRTGVALATVFVFFGAMVAVALLVGAFDSRLHEPEDVSRLGLPVLGQIPDFPGQSIGSLRHRGVRRHRVPSFLRWRRS